MMSLDDAVNLVLFAFEHGSPGEIFVQKAPAASIGQLAQVLKKIFHSPNVVKVIGTRHGEKLFETLLTREECVKAEDMGDYYRIMPDDRDLNYSKYFSEGNKKIATLQDYSSHNTYQLKDNELEVLLLGLDFIQKELTRSSI
jgi:UDP-glucose 4-epimerase